MSDDDGMIYPKAQIKPSARNPSNARSIDAEAAKSQEVAEAVAYRAFLKAGFGWNQACLHTYIHTYIRIQCTHG